MKNDRTRGLGGRRPIPADQQQIIAKALAAFDGNESELARRAVVTVETLQKYARGYQPASGRLLRLLEDISQREAAKAPQKSHREPAAKSVPAAVEGAPSSELAAVLQICAGRMAAAEITAALADIRKSRDLSEETRDSVTDVLIRSLHRKLHPAS